MEHGKRVGYTVNRDVLPDRFPTHKHGSAFWDSLGRAVATFGFLEDTLSKAIFAITATNHYEEEAVEDAYKAWLPKLQKALTDPLGSLITEYGSAVRSNSSAAIDNFDELLKDLRDASRIRNVICHGSWGLPDSSGATVPFFVDKQNNSFATPIDKAFLDQLQRGTASLACTVIDTVTQMGWQFPGSTGPGKVIWSA